MTFDIATADGTATQPSDYTQKSLTGQTIPAGSSTYSFTVLVNGDTTLETNETFFVNVTNVTGANVTDGQGQGTIVNDDAAPNLTINDVSLNEGNAGTTTFTFTVSLSASAPTGGVTFDIATANNSAMAPSDYTTKSLTGQTIPAGSSTYTFDVLVNGDTTPEPDETFFVNVTNVTGANVTDGQGQGTIVNDDVTKIHDVQGSGAATPVPGATVSVEGVVIANFQGTNKLQGFFLQEEDADVDADPNTSEGIFIFCNTCPTAVAEGQRVKATGTVSEFNNMTQITASTAGSVVVTEAGNHLAEVTPTPIDLPIVGDVDMFYEAREGMKVTFVDSLTVADYFELGRFGQITLYEGGRPRQFTEANAPSVAGNAAQADNLARRKVILDDDNNVQQSYLATSTPPGPADGLQSVYYPHAKGGFSVGTQGTDFFRGGDLVKGLTGVLHWSFPGFGADTWRIRPTTATPATFTVANPRPATPPNVGGAIKVAGMNLLNYFTTIDMTASNSSGPCGPSGTLDCRGADSVAELNRQREQASIAICTLNADIYGFAELENTTPSDSITDLLGAVNARCGGAHPYAFVNTGGTLGTDAIRVQQIYRTGIVSPVGAPLSDLDPIHNRPPTAQTYDVVDAANPAFGQRFTVIINHFKSKGCPGTGADADAGDGQGCFNATRTAQANRLLTWITGTVLPAAGDPDVLLLGDFNAYAKEDPITTLASGGFNDLETLFQGANAYSYLFDGQLGHLDYGFASASLLAQVTGAAAWHINADEVDLFDYNDEVKDAGEATFEEKPDGSALMPPRFVFQLASPYRAADHDPVLVGLFPIADLTITKTDTPDPVTAGNSLTYTITVINNGPNAAASASWNDTLPAGTTFVSLPSVMGWSCTTPAVGAGGTISCSNPSFAVGNAVFTLTVAVAPSVPAGTVLSNKATVTSTTGDSNANNNSNTAMTTVISPANVMGTKTVAGSFTQGSTATYTVTLANSSATAQFDNPGHEFTDVLPSGLTLVSASATGGIAVATVGTNTVTWNGSIAGNGSVIITITATVKPGTLGQVISNQGTISYDADGNGTNEASRATDDPGTAAPNDATSFTVLAAPPGLKTAIGDPFVCLNAGGLVVVTATVTNTNAASVTASFTATLPTTLTGLPGTGLATITPGAFMVTAGSVIWAGTIPANTTVTITYKTQLAAGTPPNQPLCINSEATFNAAQTTKLQECANVMCPTGPVNVQVSDQKAGSLLVFPYYVSQAAEQKDTRLTISNIGEQKATIHIFFIDGMSCHQADQFLCLTPNASFSFKASEYDPEATGWLLAVAVDNQGRPVQNNVLIGNAFVQDGLYVDNYGAESFRANSALVATLNNDTATLFFDNASYDAVPNQFAIELQSPADAAGQRVVTVGLSGDLTTSKMSGATQVSTAQVINGNEKPFGSFSAWLLGSCQAQATISTTSPRVPNGMNVMIPSGQVGTMKLNIGAGVGLLLTPRTAAWKGIRTLHKTGLTTTTLTIPVLVPVC